MLMSIQNLVRFCQFVLKILSGNKILTSIKGHNSVKIFQFVLEIFSGNEILTSIKGRIAVKIWLKMTGNKPKLDLVNFDVHTKFGKILSIRSQDIERKQNSGINEGSSKGITLLQIWGK